jgi:hypothetical protein
LIVKSNKISDMLKGCTWHVVSSKLKK